MNDNQSTEKISYKTVLHIFIYTVVLIMLVFMISKSKERDLLPLDRSITIENNHSKN